VAGSERKDDAMRQERVQRRRPQRATVGAPLDRRGRQRPGGPDDEPEPLLLAPDPAASAAVAAADRVLARLDAALREV
jgi:hypothetical protein